MGLAISQRFCELMGGAIKRRQASPALSMTIRPRATRPAASSERNLAQCGDEIESVGNWREIVQVWSWPAK